MEVGGQRDAPQPVWTCVENLASTWIRSPESPTLGSRNTDWAIVYQIVLSFDISYSSDGRQCNAFSSPRQTSSRRHTTAVDTYNKLRISDDDKARWLLLAPNKGPLVYFWLAEEKSADGDWHHQVGMCRVYWTAEFKCRSTDRQALEGVCACLQRHITMSERIMSTDMNTLHTTRASSHVMFMALLGGKSHNLSTWHFCISTLTENLQSFIIHELRGAQYTHRRIATNQKALHFF